MRSITDSYADSRMNAADADGAPSASAHRLSVNQISPGGVRLKRAMPGVVKVTVTVIALAVTVPFAAALLVPIFN